jgi:hypothetical protein
VREDFLKLFGCELCTHFERNPGASRTHQRKADAKKAIRGENAKGHRSHCGANQHHQIKCVCHLFRPPSKLLGKNSSSVFLLFAPANFAECHSFVSRIVSEILSR